jgi:S-formylglutathione hydrolase FrmB
MHLYLPPGYAGSREHYPVLYLLRGHEREWVNFREDASRQGENTLDVYERLLAAGEVGPMILVMPSLTSDDGVWHGFGVDNLAPDVAEDAAGIGTGRWEQCLIDDLFPLVDSHWRTLAGGAYRGLAGFSLGGAVAIRLAAKYPELFASASAYDGSFFFADEGSSRVRADDGILRNAIAAMAFGRVRDVAHATANSPAHLILRADAAALRRITWMIEYGPEALEPWGSNFYRGENLVASLRKRGIPNAGGRGVLEGGDHTWRTADRHMTRVLPLHWRKLRRALDS